MAVTENEWDMKTNERWATLDGWKRPMSLWSVGTPKTVPNTSLQYPLASPCRRKCGIQEWLDLGPRTTVPRYVPLCCPMCRSQPLTGRMPPRPPIATPNVRCRTWETSGTPSDVQDSREVWLRWPTHEQRDGGCPADPVLDQEPMPRLRLTYRYLLLLPHVYM